MAKKGYREESDSIGIVYVPRKALYGAQTQRAVVSFSNLILNLLRKSVN